MIYYAFNYFLDENIAKKIIKSQFIEVIMSPKIDNNILKLISLKTILKGINELIFTR